MGFENCEMGFGKNMNWKMGIGNTHMFLRRYICKSGIR